MLNYQRITYQNILWMEEILHQLVDVYVLIHRASTILLVVQDFATIRSVATYHNLYQEYCTECPLPTNDSPYWEKDGTAILH